MLTGLVIAVLPNSVRAQYFPANSIPSTFNDQTTSGVVLLGRKDGLLGPYANTGYVGPYLSLQHTAGDGPGYRDNGYTTLGLFAPRQSLGGILFAEGLLSVNDFGDMLGTVGGGYRRFLPNWNRTVGGGLAYDVDGGHDGTFSQVVGSFETRGKNWDIFANIYLPVGEDDKLFNQIVTPTGLSRLQFQGTNLAINNLNLVTQQFESAMRGVDIEFGGPLPAIGKYGIRGYGGWYHYEKDNITNINGGRFRLQAALTDSLTGQFLLTNDNQFDTSVIFSIAWTLPGSGASRSPYSRPRLNRPGRAVIRAQSPTNGYSDSQRYRLFQPTRRSTRVFVTRATTQTLQDNLTLLTDPVSGLPLVVFHMDSRAAVGGNGTFATPFNNPQEAQAGTGPGSIIFTHAGSVFANQANNFIALQANQQLLGEGVPHIVNTAQLGAIPIPPSGDAGPLPRFEGALGNAIQLANGSLLSGFTVANSGAGGAGAGLFAGAGLTGTTNVDNTTITSGFQGVNVTGATGTLNFATTTNINNTTNAGFNVGAATTAAVNYNGTINNTAGRAVNVNTGIGFTPNVSFNGLVTDNGGTGISVVTSGGNITFANANLTIPAGNAVTLMGNTPATIRFNNLDIVTAAGGGLIANNSGTVLVGGGNITATGGPAIFVDPTIVDMRFNNVTSINSPTFGIRLDQVSGTLAIAGTATITNPTGRGIEFVDSSANFTIANVNINGTGGAGIFLQDTSGGMPDTLTGSFTVNGGNIATAGGVSFDVVAGSAATLYQGNITHTTVNEEIVRIVGTSAAANNVFNTGTLNSTAGDGILISAAAGNASFNGTTTLSATTTRGVLINMASTGNYAFGANATITNTTGTAFEINASTPTATYSGIINQSLAARAVDINDLQVGGQATFNGTVNATAASTGFIIQNSEGNVTVSNYIAGVRATPARLMNRALDINNSTGTHQFANLDLFTQNGEGIVVRGNAAQQGLLGITTGRINSLGTGTGTSAIDIDNTFISNVTFTEVIAAATNTNAGVLLNNVGGGTFTISDGNNATVADLRVNGTGGTAAGDGLRITGMNSNSTFNFSSVDIDNTGAGGDGIDINNTPAIGVFGVVDINTTGGGRGISLDTTTGNFTFAATNIANTGGGDGVRLNAVNGAITFVDNTNVAGVNDLTITNTGGGDGIEINTPLNTAQISFTTVGISNTLAGNGVNIVNAIGVPGAMPGTPGTIAFGDGSVFTTNDLMISTMGTGDGINIVDAVSSANITFSTVDIATNGGNGIDIFGNVGTGVSGVITFDDGLDDNMIPDVSITSTGAGGGDGIRITRSGLAANFTFASVDIAGTGTGNGVTIAGTVADAAIGTITFSDNDATTMDDLRISTGGGNGIDISNTGVGGIFNFSSIDIDGTAGGIGLNIASAAGTIAFTDGNAGTSDDIRITNTVNGDGIQITDSNAAFTFSSIDISTTGTGNGVELITNGVFASSVITIDDGDIRDVGGSAFRVNGGLNAIRYNGGISSNTAGLAVDILSRRGGTITFGNNAPLDVIRSNGANAQGIRIVDDAVNGLANNVVFVSDVVLGTTANRLGGLMGPLPAVLIDHNGLNSLADFNGRLDIATTGTVGLRAVNGGRVDVIANALSRINTTGATATGVELDGSTTAITTNITFDSITVADTGAGNEGLDFNNINGTFSVTNNTSITNSGTGLGVGIDINGGAAVYRFGNDQFDSLTITGASASGIALTNLNNNFTVRGDTAIADVGNTMVTGISISGGSGNTTFGTTVGELTTITGGTATTANIRVANTLAASDVVFVGATLSGSMADGIALTNNAGNFTINDDTTITDVGNTMVTGINISGGSGNTTFGTVVGDVTTITGGTATTAGIRVANTLAANDVILANVLLSGQSGNGVTLTNNTGNFTISDGMITVAAMQTGLAATYTSTTGNITANSLVINGTGASPTAGIAVTANGTADFNLLVTNSLIGQTGPMPLTGIAVTNNSTGVLSVTLTGNTVDATTDGLSATANTVGGILELDIGTNAATGMAVTPALGNDFAPDFVFNNNVANGISLGINTTLGPTGAFGAIMNANVPGELAVFTNRTNTANPPTAVITGGNLLNGVNPNTIP